jgi:nucleoid-associated protein YgaU
MVKTRQPTLVAVILLAATLTLVGATVAAATLPSSDGLRTQFATRASLAEDSPSKTTLKSPAAQRQSSDPWPSPTGGVIELPVTALSADETSSTSKRPSITYTVRLGDTLSDIADWFKAHGFQDLYEANRAVIGSDPDLIYPGQKITVSQSGTTISRAG